MAKAECSQKDAGEKKAGKQGSDVFQKTMPCLKV